MSYGILDTLERDGTVRLAQIGLSRRHHRDDKLDVHHTQRQLLIAKRLI